MTVNIPDSKRDRKIIVVGAVVILPSPSTGRPAEKVKE